MKIDGNVVIITYGNKLNEIQMNTMRDSFLILRNSDFVAKYFPCFLQTTILFNFKLEICRPKKLYFIYNNLSKADRSPIERLAQEHARKSRDETGEISFESSGFKNDLKFNSFNTAFSQLIQGVHLSTESFVQHQYGELKFWPVIDLAFVLANRPLVELGQSKLKHYKRDPSELDADPINLQVFGFQEEYNLDFGISFSAEIVNYLESILETKVPFRHVIFLISDQNTKIESIGNILVLNSIEASKVEQSPSSLIYFSLTLSLFFARSFFGHLISYETPNEKFIVEGIRGTVALLYLQASKQLNARLQAFHQVNMEVLDGELLQKLGPNGEDHFQKVLEDEQSDQVIEEDFNRNNISAGFLNESLLSNRSFEGQPDFETKTINELLFLYLVKLKHELFRIELGNGVLPLSNLTIDSSMKTIDSISYHNLLAKFKLYFLLRELKIPSSKFVRAFNYLCKSYRYQTITSATVIDFIQRYLPQSLGGGAKNIFIQDWFRENFEKAGVNIVSAAITPKKKAASKIGSFEIKQKDLCPSNSGNPIYRNHFTDVVLYDADFNPCYHFDLKIRDSEQLIEEISGRLVPAFIDLNNSEIGYFKADIDLNSQDRILTALLQGTPIQDSKLRFKVFMHLIFERRSLEFLDSAYSIIQDESNYILLEFVLKNAAELCEGLFPTKCYKQMHIELVQEVDTLKEQYLINSLERLYSYKEEQDDIGVQTNLRLIVEYLPHFSHYNFKKARQTLDDIATRAKGLPNDIFEGLVLALLDRYFAFYNVELKEKFCLIAHAASVPQYASFLKEATLRERCEQIEKRMYESDPEKHYDEIRRVILRYNRVAASNEDFLAIKNDLEDLCTARVDEAMIVDVFPLNNFITENNSVRRYTKELIEELQRKGMFDYVTIIKEQFENLLTYSELKDQVHAALIVKDPQ